MTRAIEAMRFALLGASFAATAAIAQALPQDQQRDVNQQQRIEQGLQSGRLSTKEAGQLERGEQHIDQMQAHDLKHGAITPAEQAKLNAAQNKQSQAIYADKHNGVTGNPNSASSQRMQSDVQRDVNQQQRVANGIQNGSLTNREAGRLEQGQARVSGKEAGAAAHGGVSAREQANINHAQNKQSGRIYNKKHNAQVKS